MSNLIMSRGNFPSTLSLSQNIRRKPSSEPGAITSIFDAIGKTPLLKINKPQKIVKDLPPIKDTTINCNVYVKLEYLNPGGSIKDRVGKAMMEEAIHANVLNKKRYLLEPTSGNTGIALAMNSSVRDLTAGMVIVTRDKCSDEKLNVMRLFGADICLIHNSDSETALVDTTINNNPDKVVVLDQFDNYVNPQTHYNEITWELHNDLDKKWPDMVVMVAGTGGHFTGIATMIKQKSPTSVVVLGTPKNVPFLVEGIINPDDEIPLNLDMSLIDKRSKVSDKEAFLTARNLAKYEGVLCGGSAGLATAAAMYAIADHKEINVSGKNVVVILPDGIRNYMTKFVLDQWMEAHLFKEIPHSNEEWYKYKITADSNNLFWKLLKENNGVIEMDKDTPTATALAAFKNSDDRAAIVTDNKVPGLLDYHPMVGLASLNSYRYHKTNPRRLPDYFIDSPHNIKETVFDFMEKDVYVLKMNSERVHTVGLVARMLDITQFVVFGYEYPDPKNQNAKYFFGEYIASARDISGFINKINNA